MPSMPRAITRWSISGPAATSATGSGRRACPGPSFGQQEVCDNPRRSELMRRILTALAALALVAGSAVPSLAGMLDDIRSRGTVRIGVSLGGEPIGFRDDQNNPVGYDVDVAKMLAEKLGVPYEFTDVSGDARISMLVSGQLDIVVANTSATLERAKSVDFTIPYHRAGLRVIVQADSGIKTLADLKGKKVLVGRGTTGEIFIKKAAPEAELVYVDTFAPDGVLLLQ